MERRRRAGFPAHVVGRLPKHYGEARLARFEASAFTS